MSARASRALAILLLIHGICARSNAETTNDARIWVNLTTQGSITKGSRWRWYVDIQQRNRNNGKDADQSVARPALGYAIGNSSTVWAGYAYTVNFMPDGKTTEHRFWQQHLWSGPVSQGTLILRTRLEQRFFEGTDPIAWRIREQVRFMRPLAAKPALAPIVWDEILFHFNATDRNQRGFDQNRAFAGLGMQLAPKVRLDLGYMNQFRRNTGANQMNHILSGVLNLTF